MCARTHRARYSQTVELSLPPSFSLSLSLRRQETKSVKVKIVTVELEHPATEPGSYSVGRIELSPVRNVCMCLCVSVLLQECVPLLECVLSVGERKHDNAGAQGTNRLQLWHSL